MGLYYEDFEIDKVMVTQGRTISEADVMLFAGLSGDWTPIHVDAHFAAKGDFGQRIVHSTLTMSVAIGLMSQLKLFEGTVIGALNLSFDFGKPMFLGDTLYVDVACFEKRLTKKPGRGIVKVRLDGKNQNGELLLSGVSTTMVMTRPPAA